MKLNYVKVFGERNTGTHFLNALLKHNTDLKVLEHGVNSRAIERAAAILRSRSLASTSEEARFVLERMIDSERMAEYSSTFRWKHALVSLFRDCDLRRFLSLHYLSFWSETRGASLSACIAIGII